VSYETPSSSKETVLLSAGRVPRLSIAVAADKGKANGSRPSPEGCRNFFFSGFA